MLRIHFFGVGDGDSILLELPDGSYGLVDSCRYPGVQDPPAPPYVRGKQLAFCCLTHPHADHFDGMHAILSDPTVNTKEFWFSLSDLDVVLESLNWVPTVPADGTVLRSRASAEATDLYTLFDWVVRKRAGFESKLITGVQRFAPAPNVEVVAFGPRPQDHSTGAAQDMSDLSCPASRERS
jgi:hypothetical protein